MTLNIKVSEYGCLNTIYCTISITTILIAFYHVCSQTCEHSFLFFFVFILDIENMLSHLHGHSHFCQYYYFNVQWLMKPDSLLQVRECFSTYCCIILSLYWTFIDWTSLINRNFGTFFDQNISFVKISMSSCFLMIVFRAYKVFLMAN